MFSRWIVTNSTSARGTVHCRKTRIPCKDELVFCGQYTPWRHQRGFPQQNKGGLRLRDLRRNLWLYCRRRTQELITRRSQVLTAASMRFRILWDVAPCTSSHVEVERHYRGPDDEDSTYLWNVDQLQRGFIFITNNLLRHNTGYTHTPDAFRSLNDHHQW
jgi:hypothetical protein